MSSDDLMKLAEVERQHANDLEEAAQKLVNRAELEAAGMRRQAHDHRNRASDLFQKAEAAQQQEVQEAARHQHEAEQELQRKRGTHGLFI